MPGRIVRALKEAGTKNPVIMLDEIDKVGSDWRGDPSAALLEVLDPAQNNTFRDHYLEVDLDLSEVLFIPTANVSETIPAPLLDRMELIRLDGYTDRGEARDRPRPPAVAAGHAGRAASPRRSPSATTRSTRSSPDHTREAGVRNLEREIGKMARKVATAVRNRRVAATCGGNAGAASRSSSAGPASTTRSRQRTAVPGVATGLAVTGIGGDVLFVEATSVGGTGLAHAHRPAR